MWLFLYADKHHEPWSRKCRSAQTLYVRISHTHLITSLYGDIYLHTRNQPVILATDACDGFCTLLHVRRVNLWSSTPFEATSKVVYAIRILVGKISLSIGLRARPNRGTRLLHTICIARLRCQTYQDAIYLAGMRCHISIDGCLHIVMLVGVWESVQRGATHQATINSWQLNCNRAMNGAAIRWYDAADRDSVDDSVMK